MFALSLLYLVVGTLVASSYGAVPPYTCTEVHLPSTVSVEATIINLAPPANQSELTGFFGAFTSDTSNISAQVVAGTTTLDASFYIYQLLCVPDNFPANGTLEFGIHGINYDHTYWTFGGPGSPYNFLEAAISAGHAMFLFDRLGIGLSEHPDGIQEVQSTVQVAIAANLVQQLREGINGYTFGKIIGVGHSFGSIQTVGVTVSYGNIYDAIVLEGFSPVGSALPITLAGWGSTIAAEVYPSTFGSLPSSYVVIEGIYNDQITFYYYPYFDFSALEEDNTNRQTYTLGEVITLDDPISVAYNYTNPVLVVTGDKDYIFCGGNCYQAFGDYPNIPAGAKSLYPNVSDFTAYLPPNTGHATNQHYNAPEIFEYIQGWIATL